MNSEPIRKSLIQPILIAGCERVPFILIIGYLGTILSRSFVKPDALGIFYLIALAFSIPFAIFGLRKMAKIDPMYSRIFFRNRKYPKLIRATSNPYTEARKL